MAETSILDIPVERTGSQYTTEQRLEAAALYTVLGSDTATAAQLNIPRSTISHWRRECEWWHSYVIAIQQQTRDRTVAQLDKIVELAYSRTLERLSDGDMVLHQGELVAIPVKAKDAAIIGSIGVDKRQLLLNQPTSIRGTDTGMAALAAQFEQLAQQSRERSVVSDQ